ncbi:MAG TPA: hypothetical protein VN408_19940, partial [Actinoplanes sp.]|nr:hypothetical protein [Actinoplanes sp.]
LRTVISKQVHGTPPGHSLQEWTETGSVIEAAATELLTAVEAAGRTVLGRPWQTLAPGSGKDAVWLVEVAIDTPFGKLPDDLPGELRDAGEEVSIFVPGRATMAKYCTALLRLMNALPLDGEVIVDIGRIRQEVRRDGVLLAAPLIIPADPESQYRDEQPAA